MIKIVSNISQVSHQVSFFISKTPAAAMKVMEDMAKRVQDRMNVVGDPIQYPVNWDSEKQRRAFFATDGFGGGIPHQRSGVPFWSTQSFENEVDLFGRHAAGPVFGLMPNGDWWQSRIHRGRWVVLKDVFYEELARLPAEIKRSLITLFNGQEL